MISVDEIIEIWQQRKNRLTPLHQAALEVRQSYYGDIILPMPEMDRADKPLVANLLLQGGEQKAMRLSSTMPNLIYPSLHPGKPTYDNRARDRRLVNLAWWDLDRMNLKMRKRARHMVYYASSSVMMRPNFKERRPTWQIRNPIATFAPEMDVGELCPDDIIFTYNKSWSWLNRRYPGQMAQFGDTRDGTYTILEYQDDNEYVLAAHGEKITPSGMTYGDPVSQTVSIELERTPNRAGRCTAVVAPRIGLEHPRGEFDGVIGLWQAQAMFMALMTIGTQRSIYPEEWLVDDPNGNGAEIITHADPTRGIMGHVTGGKMEIVRPDISQTAQGMIDHLERSTRLEGGIPAELGGESASNIRTARRGSDILSSAIDFPIQEEQDILAAALWEEDRIAVLIDKVYFPTKKSFFVSATAGQITYEAPVLWETDISLVSYSHSGVDAQGLVVELGQLLGTGMISHRTAMETHPLIDDAQAEFDRIAVETMDQAMLQGLGQMAADPTMAPMLAQIRKQLALGEMEIADAVLTIHQQMQAQQAAQAQQQQQQAQAGAMAGGMGGAPPDPNAQPGMGQPTPSIAPPPGGLGNLSQLLQQLHRTGNDAVPQSPGLVGAAPGT